MLEKNFWSRVRRLKQDARREVLKEMVIREQEVGQCSNCGRVYTWDYLKNLSTQETYYVICVVCQRLKDPRYSGKKEGTSG